MPISAATELTQFFRCILSQKKIIKPPFCVPSAGARGHMPPPCCY